MQVTLYFPSSVSDMMSQRPKLPTVLWFRRAAAAAGDPSAAALAFAAKGYIVAMPELCGFGLSLTRPTLHQPDPTHAYAKWRWHHAQR